MATRAELRARLQRRLGLGAVSAVEEARLNEALNSGLARALSDRIPGLALEIFTGFTIGETPLSAADANEHTQTFLLKDTLGVAFHAATNKVFPHDILYVDESGTVTKFLVRTLSGGNVDVGVILNRDYSGGSASKLIQRSLQLPSAGQVVSVYRTGETGRSAKLSYDPILSRRDPFETGDPKYFEQRYSASRSLSFLSLWPAPENTEQFTVVQTRHRSALDDDSDTLTFPEEALYAVLERSRLAYLTWVGTHAATTVALARDAITDSGDSLKNSSNSSQIVVKQ